MEKTISEIASQLGRLGGKKSAQARLGGLSEAEKSQKMKELRLLRIDKKLKLTEKEEKSFTKEVEEVVKALNDNMTKEEIKEVGRMLKGSVKSLNNSI
jgi:uncharacterized protein (DUF2267 family)